MAEKDSLIEVTGDGLYCSAGDFFVDPWRPVHRAIVTHAHADHASRGSTSYLASAESEHALRMRMDRDANITTLPFGSTIKEKDVTVSLHPAGHILGSAQIRIEHRGRVCVISGDYKTDRDATCTPFEPVRCNEFITESTFGLPIYRWPSQESVFQEINDWWTANRDADRASVILAYALGKAQRVLAGIDPSIGPIFCHGAVQRMNEAYRKTGFNLPPTEYAGRGKSDKKWGGALIVAPPSALGSTWIRRFGRPAIAFVSGWMRVRGARRRRAVDRGFVLSDHADWPGLLEAIRATEADYVRVTHGYTLPMSRWLCENGIHAEPLTTRYVGERDDADVDTELDADESPAAADDS